MRSASLLHIAIAACAATLMGCGGDSQVEAPELSKPSTLTLVSGDAQSVVNAPAAAAQPLVVKVTDPKNRPVSGVAIAWSASDPNAKLSAAASSTDAQGQAQVTWTLGDGAGVQSVTATTTAIPNARVVFEAKNAVTSLSGTVTVARALPGSGASSVAPLDRDVSVRYSRRNIEALLAAHGAPPRRLIVQFRPGMVGASRAVVTSERTIASAEAMMRATTDRLRSRGLLGRVEISPVVLAARVTIPESVNASAAAAELRNDANVESVQDDEIVPMLDDYTYSSVTPLARRADAQAGVAAAGIPTRLPNDPLFLNEYWHYNAIDAFRAWATNTGSASVLVAVIDVGVRFDHPSMVGVFTNDGYNFVAAGPRLSSALPICASSGGGTSQVVEAGPSPDPTLPDDFAGISTSGCLVRNTLGDHGLHVSGTIGAPGNDGVGTTGVNWSVKIRPVRVLDMFGSGSFFDIAQGLLYAAGLPAAGANGATVRTSPAARVANMSLGGTSDNSVMRNAVIAATGAGVLVVASAGNSSTNSPAYPAAYPQVLSVAAVGPDLQLSSYTNVGTNVSLAAPGGDFRICCNSGGGVISTTYDFVKRSGNYAAYEGTSMAAPHVTGVAALVLAASPSLDATQLRQQLQNTAVDIGQPGRDDRFGFGLVNAFQAVTNTTSSSRSTLVRLIDAQSGDTVRSTPAAADGSFSFARIAAGRYFVVAGEDESGDAAIGVAGRRFGWAGGASPAAMTIAAGQAAAAAISVGTPVAAKPNATFAAATRLFVNSYVVDYVTVADPVATYVFQAPRAGTYIIETTGVLGTCGLGLELDSSIELYDGTQVLKTSNDDTTFPGSVLCSQISASLTPGTYYIRAFQSTRAVSGSAGGQFRIAIRTP
jgi:subtilisin family serine protease